MKRALSGVVLACLLALAGCGGHSHAIGPSQSATGSVHPPGWGGTPPGITLPAPLVGGTTSTTEMFDAVTVSNIPSHPFAVAGYTSGLFPTWASLLRDFASAHHVSIAINASHHADCLDVEPGDAVPSQAGAWARADIAAGFRTPCIYSDLSEMPAVKANLAAARLQRSQYVLWLAWYRFIPGLLQGYDAVQWTDKALGRSLDESTVTLNFLRIAQPPYAPPPVLPVCFHKREAASVCSAVKAKIASDQRAQASSQRAYVARGCPGIRDRRNWFWQHIHRPPASKRAYRTAAYNTSVIAYVRRGCPLFGGWQGASGRVGFFAGRVRALEAAN